MDKLTVWFNECSVCGNGSMTAICSDFCASVHEKWKAGEYGHASLRKSYAMEKAALEIADTIIGELLSDHGRLL